MMHLFDPDAYPSLLEFTREHVMRPITTSVQNSTTGSTCDDRDTGQRKVA